MSTKISKEEIRTVIRRVLTYYMRRGKMHQRENQILFLVPDFPIALSDILAEYELYDQLNAVTFFLGSKDSGMAKIQESRVYYKDRKEDVTHVLNVLTTFSKLCIYAPSLDFLRDLIEGKEKDLFVRIAIYFRMTGKSVIVRLPYDPQSPLNGKFGKRIRDLAEDLWDMGVSFDGLVPGFEEFADLSGEGTEDLVTEQIVEIYYKNGYRQIRAVSDALVTPLARERARELGIYITTQKV